jgi:transposase-like protein
VRLEQFEAEWGKRYPAVGAAWRRAWERVSGTMCKEVSVSLP